jgi:hypothetical protein
MKSRVYASIDLDYFYGHDENESKKFIKFCYKLIKALEHRTDIVLVADHHELLPYINQLKPTKIIHVDMHSDLVKKKHCRELHCGNFLSYVNNKKRCELIWHYPKVYRDSMSLGDCNADGKRDNNIWHYKHWMFKKQNYTYKYPSLESIVNADKIGIAISPDYCINRESSKDNSFTSDFEHTIASIKNIVNRNQCNEAIG